MAQQHTHEFDCPTCGAHLDSRQDLERHNAAKHPESQRRGDLEVGARSPSDLRGSPVNPTDQRS